MYSRTTWKTFAYHRLGTTGLDPATTCKTAGIIYDLAGHMRPACLRPLTYIFDGI